MFDVMPLPPPRPRSRRLRHLPQSQDEEWSQFVEKLRGEIRRSKKQDNLKWRDQQSSSLLTQTQNAHNTKKFIFFAHSMKLTERLFLGILVTGAFKTEMGVSKDNEQGNTDLITSAAVTKRVP